MPIDLSRPAVADPQRTTRQNPLQRISMVPGRDPRFNGRHQRLPSPEPPHVRHQRARHRNARHHGVPPRGGAPAPPRMLPMQGGGDHPYHVHLRNPNCHGVRRGAPVQFPTKLRAMCDEEDPSIIGWAGAGLSIIVCDRHRLEMELLPKYFRHSKFTSFARQLNLYGFQKCDGHDSRTTCWSHPLFRWDRPDLVRDIVRAKDGRKTGRRASSPDFVREIVRAKDGRKADRRSCRRSASFSSDNTSGSETDDPGCSDADSDISDVPSIPGYDAAGAIAALEIDPDRESPPTVPISVPRVAPTAVPPALSQALRQPAIKTERALRYSVPGSVPPGPVPEPVPGAVAVAPADNLPTGNMQVPVLSDIPPGHELRPLNSLAPFSSVDINMFLGDSLDVAADEVPAVPAASAGARDPRALVYCHNARGEPQPAQGGTTSFYEASGYRLSPEAVLNSMQPGLPGQTAHYGTNGHQWNYDATHPSML